MRVTVGTTEEGAQRLLALLKDGPFELMPGVTITRVSRAFEPGQVVVWHPNNFNKEWWERQSEEDRVRYYGRLGYGAAKPKTFVYLSPILDGDGTDSGHCVLLDMDDGHIEYMRHTVDFRPATNEEF